MKDANVLLLGACRSGNLAKVQSALSQGATQKAKGLGGVTPFSLAVDGNHKEILRVLNDKFHWSGPSESFAYALAKNNMAMASWIVGLPSFDIHKVGYYVIPTMFSTPLENDPVRLKLVKLILKKTTKAHLDRFCHRLADVRCDVFAMSLLLDKGLDVNFTCSDQFHRQVPYLRHRAINNPDMLSLFLDRGAQIEAKNLAGFSLLLSACDGFNVQSVRLLLDRGADMESQDNAGRTALARLLCEVQEGPVHARDAMIPLLIERGAVVTVDVDAPDARGDTIFTKLCIKGLVNSTALLRKRGAKIDVVGPAGNTALHRAAFAYAIADGERLVAFGSELTALDSEGRTPLDLVGNFRDGQAQGGWNTGPLSLAAKEQGRARLRAAREQYEQRLRDENWQRRKDAIVFAVRSGLRPTAAQLAAEKAAQALVDTSAAIPPIPRGTVAENRAFLLRAVLGSDGLLRRIILFL